MSGRLTIALDAMGGDHAPDMVVAGAALARERHPGVDYLMFGDEHRIGPLLARRPGLRDVTTIQHTPDAVSGDAKAAVALRGGRNTSMRRAIDAVAEGRAGVVVSAGNTGALMAMAKMVLKTLPGIERMWEEHYRLRHHTTISRRAGAFQVGHGVLQCGGAIPHSISRG